MAADDPRVPAMPKPGDEVRSSSAAAHQTIADRSLDSALDLLRALLVPGEILEAHAIQRRLFALAHRRVLVAATSGRFIALTRHLLGGYTPVDVRWQDLHDASLREGIFGADLMITSAAVGDLASADRPGRSIMFQGLRKDEARRVYRVCQGQEQAWREKRRVRDLDEMRAKSGGIQLGAAVAPGLSSAPVGEPASADSPAARLRRAKEMLDSGLITDAEYESIKARIVDGL
ncbi:MAG TPA: SHOCT domain-containing protein [Gemmatimonadaceae bacterium]|nr:SHOCT domain-containing protein [Gemmatimonadaceae bacterium]